MASIDELFSFLHRNDIEIPKRLADINPLTTYNRLMVISKIRVEVARAFEASGGRGFDWGVRFGVSPEALRVLSLSPVLACRFAKKVGRRWPVAEGAIASDAEASFNYARYVIKGRWGAGEAAIASDPIHAYNYAFEVVKGRWPEGEAAIFGVPYYALLYVRDVVNKGRPVEGVPIRVPGAEGAILNHAGRSYEYCRDILRGRWPEFERRILAGAYDDEGEGAIFAIEAYIDWFIFVVLGVDVEFGLGLDADRRFASSPEGVSKMVGELDAAEAGAGDLFLRLRQVVAGLRRKLRYYG